MFKKIKSRFANFIGMATLSNLFKGVSKQKYFLLLVTVISISMPIHKASAGDGWDILGGIMSKIVFSVMYIVSFFCLFLASFFVKIGAYLVDVMLDQGIYAIIFDISNPTNPLMAGWAVIRDFANTFFIFILLLIAFSTILRISKYSVKSLLPKFIIALFLINFSAIVALIVIDLGQVFMYEISSWMDNGFSQNNGAMGNITSIVDNVFLATYDMGGNIKDDTGWSMQNAVGVSFAAIFTLILGFVYILLAGFLLIRLTVLAILVVLSPVAFLGIIIPGLSSHAATWWKKLFEYSLFGPIFIFFIYLSSQMANSLMTYPSPTSTAGLEWLSALIATIIPYCVSMAMLLAVIPVTKQLGMAGSGALIGGAMGVGKIAVGTFAGVKLAGGLGKKAVDAPVGRAHSVLKGQAEGRFKGYNKLAKKIGGGIKKIPFIGEIQIKKEVAQAEKNQEKVAEKEKFMDKLTDVDKKNYVNSPKLDMNEKAERTQAMFNLLSKDSGKGMTDENLTKLFHKDKIGIDDKVEKDDHGNKIQEFDKDALMSAYGSASAHNLKTSEQEKVRPDLIIDEDNKRKKVAKLVADGDYNKIKEDALKDNVVDNQLRDSLTKDEYKKFHESKTRGEREGFAEHLKDTVSVDNNDGTNKIKGLRDGKGNVNIDVAKLVSTLEKGSKNTSKSIKDSFKSINTTTKALNPITVGSDEEKEYKKFVNELKSLGDLNTTQLKEAMEYTNKRQIADSTGSTTTEQKDAIFTTIQDYKITGLGNIAKDGTKVTKDHLETFDYVTTDKRWGNV